MPSNFQFTSSVIWTATLICIINGAPTPEKGMLDKFIDLFTSDECKVSEFIVLPYYTPNETGDTTDTGTYDLSNPLEGCINSAYDNPAAPLCTEVFRVLRNLSTCNKDIETLTRVGANIKPFNISAQENNVCEWYSANQTIFADSKESLAYKLADKQMCSLVCRDEVMLKACSFLLWGHQVQASIYDTLRKAEASSGNEDPELLKANAAEDKTVPGSVNDAARASSQNGKNSDDTESFKKKSSDDTGHSLNEILTAHAEPSKKEKVSNNGKSSLKEKKSDGIGTSQKKQTSDTTDDAVKRLASATSTVSKTGNAKSSNAKETSNKSFVNDNVATSNSKITPEKKNDSDDAAAERGNVPSDEEVKSQEIEKPPEISNPQNPELGHADGKTSPEKSGTSHAEQKESLSISKTNISKGFPESNTDGDAHIDSKSNNKVFKSTSAVSTKSTIPVLNPSPKITASGKSTSMKDQSGSAVPGATSVSENILSDGHATNEQVNPHSDENLKGGQISAQNGALDATEGKGEADGSPQSVNKLTKVVTDLTTIVKLVPANEKTVNIPKDRTVDSKNGENSEAQMNTELQSVSGNNQKNDVPPHDTPEKSQHPEDDTEKMKKVASDPETHSVKVPLEDMNLKDGKSPSYDDDDDENLNEPFVENRPDEYSDENENLPEDEKPNLDSGVDVSADLNQGDDTTGSKPQISEQQSSPDTKRVVSNIVEESQIISRVQGAFPDQEDTHFFFYFITIVVFAIGGYVLFHNKQKIFALIIEGRHERRRRSGASYRKLETK